MLYKDNLIKNIHKDYRDASWINELDNSIGLSLDKVEADAEDLELQYDFNTLTWSIPTYEKKLGIKTNLNNTIEDRRSFIQAKWISNGKAEVALLQAVANSWKNGNTSIKFTNGIIKITFNGEYGVPVDLATLIIAINEVKPAHLPLEYIFAYILIKDIKLMTINQLQATKINAFAGGM